jgi:hypothetical protein
MRVIDHQFNPRALAWRKCAADEVLEPPGRVKKINVRSPEEAVEWTLVEQQSPPIL